MAEYKRIPYGISNFRQLRREGLYYVDKTMYVKKLKDNCNRILMLGVSPVTMDDLTSGYNIATSITMNLVFNMMLGFSEEDVRQIQQYAQDEKVRLMCHDTTLHRIVAQKRGYKMVRIEEI